MNEDREAFIQRMIDERDISRTMAAHMWDASQQEQAATPSEDGGEATDEFDLLLDWLEGLLHSYDWLGTGSDQASADRDEAEAWEKWERLCELMESREDQHSRIVAAKDAEIARLCKLAYIGEHQFEDCTYKFRLEELRAQPARQVGGDELILGSQAAAIGVAHELLAWNRSHSTPPIVVGLEYWVAQEALRMARAALAPAAVVMPDKDEYHQIAFEIGGTEGGAYHFEADELDAFIARLNRRVIPVELLKRVRDTLEYWINRVDTRGMSKTDYNSWLALGHHSKAMTALRALLGKEGER